MNRRKKRRGGGGGRLSKCSRSEPTGQLEHRLKQLQITDLFNFSDFPCNRRHRPAPVPKKKYNRLQADLHFPSVSFRFFIISERTWKKSWRSKIKYVDRNFESELKQRVDATVVGLVFDRG